VGVLFGRTFI